MNKIITAASIILVLLGFISCENNETIIGPCEPPKPPTPYWFDVARYNPGAVELENSDGGWDSVKITAKIVIPQGSTSVTIRVRSRGVPQEYMSVWDASQGMKVELLDPMPKSYDWDAIDPEEAINDCIQHIRITSTGEHQTERRIRFKLLNRRLARPLPTCLEDCFYSDFLVTHPGWGSK